MRHRQRRLNSSAKPLLGTVHDAAQMLGTGINFIYDAMNAGELEKIKLGGRTMITIKSIERLAETGFKKPAA